MDTDELNKFKFNKMDTDESNLNIKEEFMGFNSEFESYNESALGCFKIEKKEPELHLEDTIITSNLYQNLEDPNVALVIQQQTPVPQNQTNKRRGIKRKIAVKQKCLPEIEFVSVVNEEMEAALVEKETASQRKRKPKKRAIEFISMPQEASDLILMHEENYAENNITNPEINIQASESLQLFQNLKTTELADNNKLKNKAQTRKKLIPKKKPAVKFNEQLNDTNKSNRSRPKVKLKENLGKNKIARNKLKIVCKKEVSVTIKEIKESAGNKSKRRFKDEINKRSTETRTRSGSLHQGSRQNPANYEEVKRRLSRSTKPARKKIKNNSTCRLLRNHSTNNDKGVDTKDKLKHNNVEKISVPKEIINKLGEKHQIVSEEIVKEDESKAVLIERKQSNKSNIRQRSKRNTNKIEIIISDTDQSNENNAEISTKENHNISTETNSCINAESNSNSDTHNLNESDTNMLDDMGKSSKTTKKLVRKKLQLTEEQQAERQRKSLEKRTCKICDRVLAFPKHLRDHIMSKHMDEKPYSCEHCGKKYSTLKTYYEHKRSHDIEKLYLCNYCGKSFYRRTDLTSHIQGHVLCEKQRKWKCKSCPKEYASRGSCRKHTLSKHTDPSNWKHECNICQMKLFSGTELKLHMRRHNDDRRHKCIICGRAFFTKQSKDIHVRTHSGSTHYNCPNCPNGYRSNEALQRHLWKKHDVGEEKPPSAPTHFCTVCKKGFCRKSLLERHTKIHEIGKEAFLYKCQKCNRKYNARHYYTIHLLDKHGIKIAESYFKTVLSSQQQSMKESNTSQFDDPEHTDTNDSVSIKSESHEISLSVIEATKVSEPESK